MAGLSQNPDREFSASCEKKRDPEIDRLLSEPSLLWDHISDDADLRARVGKLIADALLGRSGRH